MIRKNTATFILLNVVVLLLINSGSVSYAQQNGCVNIDGFDGFDFWLGEWEVTDNITGNRAGSNSIKKMEGGCMLLESWTGAGGGTGTSVNYYNPVNQQWRQLWVSAGQYSIDIAGGIVSGSMVLSGQLFNFAGTAVEFRGTWTPGEDGSVRQFFEQYNNETEKWDVWFDGRYVHKS